MKSREINLWLDERWYQALSQHLEVKTLEERLSEYLNELINQLPPQVHDKIAGEIREEELQREQELAASQKYAAFRITENGVTEQFQMKQAAGMVEAATLVRRWLRQAERRPFHEILSGRESISAEEFDRMANGCVEGDRKTTGVYDVNLDVEEFSAVRPDLGWITYRLKDVSTASWHSYRSGSYDRDRRQFRLMEKLADKEIPSAGHLSSENTVFSDGLIADNGQLNFYMETTFDVDKVFGTRIRLGESDDTLNIYANYDCAAGQVRNALEVDLHWADGREKSLEYRLNAAEKAVLLRKMEDYCWQQTGQMLEDYSAQLLTEDLSPPSAPSM